jgi:hypothetical protein
MGNNIYCIYLEKPKIQNSKSSTDEIYNNTPGSGRGTQTCQHTTIM